MVLASLARAVLARLFLPPPAWHTQVYDWIDESAIAVLTRNGLPVHLLSDGHETTYTPALSSHGPRAKAAASQPRYVVVWPDALLWYVAPEGLLVELADGTRLVHDTELPLATHGRSESGRREVVLRYLATYDPRFDSRQLSVRELRQSFRRTGGTGDARGAGAYDSDHLRGIRARANEREEERRRWRA